MKQDDYDLLSQFIDGELDTAEATEVKRRLLAEPELNELYQQLKQLNDSVKTVIPDFLNEPLSDELKQLLKQTSPAQTNESDAMWRRFLPMAASIALVFVMGYAFISQPFQGNGMTIKGSMLSKVADDENWLSENGTEVVVVQSYQSAAQSLCREYYARADNKVEHGVSCYEQGQWQKQVFAIKDNDSEQYYVTASSSYNDVEQFVVDNHLLPLTENKAHELLEKLD
ncbi:anti-sigma factor family protein [Planctobacterium marinum]|uniref:Anti-sigma factor n=1 Tax=Planctobacterium marinum TaxID=1631968 RepID=A0AA48KNU0_9ALTE|nr:anti-sigma factor [Planctobacterium marinum]